MKKSETLAQKIARLEAELEAKKERLAIWREHFPGEVSSYCVEVNDTLKKYEKEVANAEKYLAKCKIVSEFFAD